MDYKQVYEKFWSQGLNMSFEGYIRNSLLPTFFPATSNKEKVADIAGGNGIVSAWLAQQGYDVTLVEMSDEAVRQARTHGVEKIVQMMVDQHEPLPFADNYFDKVFFGDIIEHLFDAESALREVKRILKPHGQLIVSCPNIAYWRFRMYYMLDGDFQRIDVAKQKPWEQEHIRFYNIKILKEFLATIGFKFTRFAGVNDIWHSRMLASKYPHLFAHTIVSEFENIK